MAAIAIIIATFAAGAAAGIVVIVSLGIRREERDLTLTGHAPDRKSQGARSLTGLYVRQRSDSPPFFTAPVGPGRAGRDHRRPAARRGRIKRPAPGHKERGPAGGRTGPAPPRRQRLPAPPPR